MAILPIKILGDKVLRQLTETVTSVTPELKELATNMLETMYNTNGIGLAAPQIGKTIKLIVIDVEHGKSPYIMFNPEIIEKSIQQYKEDEGCLSIPKIYAPVIRHEQITVNYIDEEGQPKTLDANNMLGKCIQHECDHLDGILFIDRLNQTDKLLLKNKLKKLKNKK